MLTPNDISSKKFEKSAFGYKPEEVDAFLSDILGSYNEMYQENLQHRTGYKTCSHCSMISYGGGRFYPANLCGLCGHYCPACTAPKESPVP